MSFLRPKVKQEAAVTPPSTVASPSDLLNSVARLRRMKGGRNSFSASQTSSAASGGVGAQPNTLTGVNA